MALVHKFLAAIRRDEEGQGLAEYALILALIAIVAIIALIFLGNQVSSILSTVGGSVSAPPPELSKDRRLAGGPSIPACASAPRPASIVLTSARSAP